MQLVLTRPVLVLDAGYQAVNVVPVRRALLLLARGKAVPVEEDAAALCRSEHSAIAVPLIIRLFVQVAHKLYRRLQVRYNKRNVFARDGHRCQYCGSKHGPLTIDHVFPRSRRSPEHPEGGSDSWENCVTACVRCNLRKGNRTPEEAGMPLLQPPSRPAGFLPLLARPTEPGLVAAWQKYLY